MEPPETKLSIDSDAKLKQMPQIQLFSKHQRSEDGAKESNQSFQQITFSQAAQKKIGEYNDEPDPCDDEFPTSTESSLGSSVEDGFASIKSKSF